MKKVLIVDDEPTNRILLRCCIGKQEGVSIIEAGDGIEAIEKAEEHKPDLIFMDFKMPLMNGGEASVKIKENNKDVIIVLLTAYDLREVSESRELMKAFDEKMTKPISLDMIDEILSKYI